MIKFGKDLTFALLGLILAISFLFTIFSVVGYFFNSNVGDVNQILKFSVPVLVITSIIAWRKKEIFWSMFGWMFPWL